MDILNERSYPTPLSNSSLLPLLLLSLTKQRHTPHSTTWIKDEYDYIVVGGGAAGSVVASRLSEEPHINVLLLEAGPEPPILTEVPSFGPYFGGTKVDWNLKTVHQKHAAYGLENQQIGWPMGKMLGGTGNHNGMAYVRGNRKNYDDWAAQGAKGWSYKEVFPYFLKLEDNTSPTLLANGYHATGGPITVEESSYNPDIKIALKEAATILGYQFVDSNAAKQTGFCDVQRNTRDHQRCSSVKAYLVPAENGTNLDIMLNAMVTKIIIDDGRAVGAEYFHDGQFRFVKARREIVLSGGTTNTPKLLMLSGIGPREELQKFQIPVLADLPVGKNLQEHALSPYFLTLGRRYPTFDEKIKNPINILRYIKNRSGPLSGPSTLMQAFLNGQNIAPDVDFPNYCLLLDELAGKTMKHLGLKSEVYKKFISPYEGRAILACASQNLQPKSRGTITLKSSNPFDPPLIDPNFFEDPRDLENMVDGLKMCKKLTNASPVRNLGVKPFETLVPGCERYHRYEEEYFRCYAETLTFINFHAVGTCKMGDPEDPTMVVDPKLRVKTIKGLRVVDASVMPIISSANTQIPTIMIAEKACDMIKETIHNSERIPHCAKHTF